MNSDRLPPVQPVRDPVLRRRGRIRLLTRSVAAAALAVLVAGPLAGPLAGPAAATTVAPPTGSPLSWAPPALQAPTTVLPTSTNRDLRLDPAKDYVVQMPATPLSALGGLQITGGRNVVLIGGQIDVPAGATATNNANRGLYLKGQTGTVHVEGLRISGAGLGEGINLDQQLGAVVQLQNIRVDTVRGSQAGHHADVIQTWAGPRKLLVDGLTGYTQYQGMFLLPQQFGAAAPELMDFRRMDLRGTSTSGYMVWRDTAAWPMSATDVWVSPRSATTPLANVLHPAGSGPGTQTWPSVSAGTPPTGEFVPAGTAGPTYVSPGYLTGTGVAFPVTVPRIATVDGARLTEGVHYTAAPSVELTWAGSGPSTKAYRVVRDGAVLAQVAAPATRVRVPVGGDANALAVQALGADGVPVSSPPAAVVVDTVAPSFTGGPVLRLRSGAVGSTGALPLVLGWAATDAVRLHATALTTPVKGSYAPTKKTAYVSRLPRTETWTLVAEDSAGNKRTAAAPFTTAMVHDSATQRTGTWSTVTSSSHVGGSAMSATAAGATMSHTFTGRSVAWTALRSPTSGKATIYVDGARVMSYDLYASTVAPRQVVWNRNWSAVGTHTIKIVVEGTAGRPGVTSDGFITVR